MVQPDGRNDGLRLTTHAFAYEACDIPPGMTLRTFRALRSDGGAERRRMALSERLRRLAASAMSASARGAGN
jgi:hypothetical protein